jgi:hypothetical protein
MKFFCRFCLFPVYPSLSLKHVSIHTHTHSRARAPIHTQVLVKYCLFIPCCQVVLWHVAGSICWAICYNSVVPVYSLCSVFSWCVTKNTSHFINHLLSTVRVCILITLPVCFTLWFTYIELWFQGQLPVFSTFAPAMPQLFHFACI